MKRPLVPIALLFAGGILLGDHFAVRFPILIGVAFALLISALIWNTGRPYLLCPLIFVAGWLGMLVDSVVISPNDLRTLVGNEPQLATIRAKVIETPYVRSHENAKGLTFRTLARASITEI